MGYPHMGLNGIPQPGLVGVHPFGTEWGIPCLGLTPCLGLDWDISHLGLDVNNTPSSGTEWRYHHPLLSKAPSRPPPPHQNSTVFTCYARVVYLLRSRSRTFSCYSDLFTDLNRLYIDVSNNSDGSSAQRCFYEPSSLNSGTTRVFTCPSGMHGRYVRIRYAVDRSDFVLCLCEVQVQAAGEHTLSSLASAVKYDNINS